MAWLASGMATMAARVKALLVVPLAAATMAARVMALLVMVSLAPTLLLALLLALLLSLPALVLAGTRAQRLEQLTRQRGEALGLVRGRRQQQQLLRHRGAAAAAA